MLSWRPVLPGEVCFRLGDELLRIGRTEKAAEYFQQAKQRAPDSPLSFEGLGLLAAEQHNHTEAVHQFGEAIAHGSTSFMAHYMFAREKLAVTAKTPDRYSRIKPELAVEIRAQLKKSLALMPDFDHEFTTHRQGVLGTVQCTPWHRGEEILLVGDAAHAIVPFHGQGMNCALEDCLLLDAMLADGAPAPFARFSATRRVDTDAIATMSLENYAEMRDEVLDPRFQQQQALALALQQRHPARFIPRYAMVMFRPDIPYSVALARGRIQQQMLEELTRDAVPDLALADRMVAQRLPPLDRGAVD
jgi:2-polyprenyl-6-methoxyphenol hydroxylase-like FAD-dependent oxidoreductase